MTAPTAQKDNNIYIVTYKEQQKEADPYKPGEYYTVTVNKYKLITKDEMYQASKMTDWRDIKYYKVQEVTPKFNVTVSIEV
jgi:hypothetical protein